MTGTSGADDGSRATEADDTGPAGETTAAQATGPAGGTTAADGPSRGAPDRWRRWVTRTGEWGTVARRLWAAARPLLRQLRWPDQEPDRPAVTLVVRRVAPVLRLPAQGHVYHFVVRTMFTWSSDDARPELFGWYVDYFQQHAMHRLRRIAARCAAQFPPDRPGALARALAAALTGEDAPPWDYAYGDATLRCEPEVAVYLDEPVRRLLQPYWDQRIALEWERDLHRRRAAYADEQRSAPASGADEHPAAPPPDADGRPPRPAPDVDDQPAGPAPGTPGVDRPLARHEERPPRQRGTPPGTAPPRPGQQRRPGPRPHSAVEQFNLLDPLLQPPAMPPAEPDRPWPEDPARGDRETGPPAP